jgi:hypothetical protein
MVSVLKDLHARYAHFAPRLELVEWCDLKTDQGYLIRATFGGKYECTHRLIFTDINRLAFSVDTGIDWSQIFSLLVDSFNTQLAARGVTLIALNDKAVPFPEPKGFPSPAPSPQPKRQKRVFHFRDDAHETT